ncbi:MAG: TetR/AcrR family transcriptional regulator [Myxococcota bacterium]
MAILDAAGNVLERLGLAMKMDDVAAEADVSKGTLYLYFSSKDALLAGFAERNLASLLPRLRTRANDAATGLDAVAGIIEENIEFFQAHPTSFRLMVGWLQQPEVDDSSDDFQAYRARLQEVHGTFLGAFERGKADHSIRADVDTVHHAMQVWASTVGVVLMHQNTVSLMKRITIPIDFSQLVPVHLDAIRRLLAVHP